jgi:uncharacterized protein YjbI with pentapeptide repeats
MHVRDDSADHYEDVVDTLIGFIRQRVVRRTDLHSPGSETSQDGGEPSEEAPERALELDPDVQAALTALTGRPMRKGSDRVLDLSELELTGAKLQGAYLRNVNFRDARVSEANLSGGRLQGVDLYGADISGTDFRGAHLKGADLRHTRLNGADLRDANLDGADLRGASLVLTDFRGANLTGALIYEGQLKGVEIDEHTSLPLKSANSWD